MSGTFSTNPSANAVGVQLFNAAYYLANNADVAAAASRGTITAQQHFIQFGQFENRNPGSFFDAQAYIAANPDVASALGRVPGLTAWSHFINFGVVENRGTGTFSGNFNAAAYLAANPDVQAAVTAGTIRSAFEHFILYGAAEGRVGVSTTGQVLNTTNPGATTTLTVNEDNLTGSGGNDTFNAPGVTTAFGGAANTLNGADRINGGGGTDTLNATLSGNAAGFTAPTLVSVENVAVRFVDAPSTLSLGASTGVQQVVVSESTSIGAVTSVGTAALAVRQQQAVGAIFDGSTATKLSLTLDTLGLATKAVNVDLGSTVAATGTALALTVGNAFAAINSTVNDAFKTVTVAAAGTNAITFTDSAATITSLTTTGSGSIDYRGAAFTAIKTFDASASTGNIKVDVQSAAAASVKTGSGNDLIDMDTTVAATSSIDAGKGNDQVYVGAQLGKFDAVAGGEGTDVINVTDGATWIQANVAKISGFEALDVSGGKGTYDVSLAGVTAVQIDQAVNGALSGAVTFSNAPAAFGLTVSNKASTDFGVGQDIVIALKDASGKADAITVTSRMTDGDNDALAEGSIAYTTVKASGVENVTLNSTVVTADTGVAAAKYTASIATLDVDAIRTLTITGNGSTNVGILNPLSTLTAVDASGSTGNVTIPLAGILSATSYTGSSGVDTVKSSNGGTSFYTAQGADVVTLTNAAVSDLLIYKVGTDSQLTDASKDGKITLGADAATIDAIGGFTQLGGAAADRFDVTAIGFTGTQRGLVDVTALVTANTDLTSVTGLFNSVGGQRGVANSVVGGDSYVFIDVNRDGNFTANTDLAVKVNGVLGLTAASFDF
ncbi:hypothetical protein KTR66_24220 [Roseococcus sp. SDR]|uniref:beta strand repeat-containing protein n=1 Tax=Roseococcus sp. SDR TaxID=2835532 RepID=UPI001BCC25F1|nr:hypothetical protein [Roseococcus sp. SDR]MBS7793110.1 hypothetical protein [Roseococcus sp. SDR]MBV1848424.1 hypothetical protein [Roseococcus sp. SDR]